MLQLLAKGQGKARQPTTAELREICVTWERIVHEVFGDEALGHVDNFGRYIVLRQQKIFQIDGKSEGYVN